MDAAEAREAAVTAQLQVARECLTLRERELAAAEAERAWSVEAAPAVASSLWVDLSVTGVENPKCVPCTQLYYSCGS